ncbi:TIGR00282 family metallophosphoesterase [bacterium]|nr:TIGR00282 family metallophosphoesterase [bacterium]
MKILLIGDIVGKPGRQVVERYVGDLRQEHAVDLVIANGENAASGKGITPQIADDLFGLGVDVITTGNHIWHERSIIEYLEKQPHILRPANYPGDAPGRGWTKIRSVNYCDVVVINLLGRINLGYFDCPFRCIDQIIAHTAQYPVKIIDFHSETTSEKVAFGWYVAGRVTAVAGTHTHIQTADYRILPGDTGYISDVGMCGSWDSVIGIEKEQALYNFINQRPIRFTVAHENLIFCAVLFEVDEDTGKALSVKPIWLPQR